MPSQKFYFKRKSPTFRPDGRRFPMSSLLVFLLIHRLRSRLFSLSLSLYLLLYVCRHIKRAIHEFIAFFKIYVCFSKKEVGHVMHVPAKRNAGCSIGIECLISHWLTWRSARTDGRTEVTS